MHLKIDLASADGVLRVVIGAREKEEADLVTTMMTVDMVFSNYSIPDCPFFWNPKMKHQSSKSGDNGGESTGYDVVIKSSYVSILQ